MHTQIKEYISGRIFCYGKEIKVGGGGDCQAENTNLSAASRVHMLTLVPEYNALQRNPFGRGAGCLEMTEKHLKKKIIRTPCSDT